MPTKFRGRDHPKNYKKHSNEQGVRNYGGIRMTENYARNYSDLNHPSSVSGGGAFAEYILPDKEGWDALGFGSTVIIEDRRDGKQVWMSGQVIEIKSLSPFLADRDVMLYNREEQGDQAISMLDEIQGPHNEQRPSCMEASTCCP